ncbi:MAG: DUF4347 domain-containing protein, partial [Cyanobacteria bacterium J06553_1]
MTLQNTPTKSALVVIDPSVAQVPALINDLLGAEIEVLVLSANRDGVTQITEALEQQHTKLSSLHIVAHGTPGCLNLGNSQLSFQTLSQQSSSLTRWATILAEKDVLLYGCQLAKGAMGYLFLQQLHQLTGANIAASTERVG